MSSSRARSTLSAALRTFDDAALAELYRARPDLLSPVPPTTIGVLAQQASSQHSVLLALDGLDVTAMRVLDALLQLDEGARMADILPELGLPPDGVGTADPTLTAARAAVADAIRTLASRALIWKVTYDGTDEGALDVEVAAAERYVVARTLRDRQVSNPSGFGPPLDRLLRATPPHRLNAIATALDLPAGAGPPEIGEALKAPGKIAELITQATDITAMAEDALHDMAEQPLGYVANALRQVRFGEENTSVELLLTRGLLIALDDMTIVMPREVGFVMRGEDAAGPASLVGPRVTTEPRDAVLATHTAAGAAQTVVEQVATLMEAWSARPPTALRAGGLPVRELKAAATLLGLDESGAAFVAELAYGAGLCVTTVERNQPLWVPTISYDRWLAQPPADRWVELAQSWLESHRLAGLAGQRTIQDKRIAPLDPESAAWDAPRMRAGVLGVLAEVPSGEAATPMTVAEVARHRMPRLGRGLDGAYVDWTLAEAAHLGVTGLGMLTPVGRQLLTHAPAQDVASTLAPELPEPVGHVLIQADLTAIAPGPLTPDAAADLGAIADIESTGGATVFRFTPESIRRALDHGRSASEVHALLAARSRTPVPQPLTYLVDDLARRHGRVRVTPVGAVIRADDPAVLDAIERDRALGKLGLRRIAPTVLIADEDATHVLTAVRAAGHAPVEESVAGELVARVPVRHRAKARRATSGARPRRELASPEDAVRTLRQGEQLVHARPSSDRVQRADRDGAHHSTSAIQQTLSEAIDRSTPVWLTEVDTDGMLYERLLKPYECSGGWCRGFDMVAGRARTVAVHRITAVAHADAGEMP